MGVIDSVLVPQKLLQSGMSMQNATILYAQLTGKASIFTNIPMTLTAALSASIIPIISELYILKNKNGLENKINLSIRLSMLVALPCFLGLYFMAGPIMKLIFPGKSEGFIILKYLALSIPFLVITNITTSILQGTRYYYRPVLNLFIGCVIKVILTTILVPMPNLNIYGAVIATISAYFVVAILNVVYMVKKLKCRFYFTDIVIKPIIASLLMITGVLLTYLKITDIGINSSLSCLISIFVGIIIYVVLIILLKILRYDEIKERKVYKK